MPLCTYYNFDVRIFTENFANESSHIMKIIKYDQQVGKKPLGKLYI
jgi:hypothetical protein